MKLKLSKLAFFLLMGISLILSACQQQAGVEDTAKIQESIDKIKARLQDSLDKEKEKPDSNAKQGDE